MKTKQRITTSQLPAPATPIAQVGKGSGCRIAKWKTYRDNYDAIFVAQSECPKSAQGVALAGPSQPKVKPGSARHRSKNVASYEKAE
jgi:hypothetical protein